MFDKRVQSRISQSSLTRRRFVGAGAGSFAAAMFAGAALPGGLGSVVMAQDGGTEFHSAWPYLDLGAGGHLNHFVTNGIMNPPNIYGDLMFVPMAMLYWADSSWLPLVAESWSFSNTGYEGAEGATPMASPVAGGEDDINNADTLQVVLRQGVNWSDGNPVTAQDVKDTFDILRLQSNTAWDYLGDVEIVDDATINFFMKVPSTVVERYVIRRSPMPSAIYGEWAERLRALVDDGKTSDDPEWTQLVDQFNQFRPEELIVNGPYTIDLNSITNAQFNMPKNPDSYWAEQAKFDRIVNYNGETDTISAVVLSGDIDYATHGFAPATEQAMIDQGIRVLRPRQYGGTGLIVNYNAMPQFSDKRVRQALLHIIDREEVAFVSLARSAEAVKYHTGMSDALAEQWLAQEDLDSLNQYPVDHEGAAALLEEAGWSKDGDLWMDADGNEVAFELTYPSEFANQAATGENVAEQLRAFGWNVTTRSITYTQVGPDVLEGRFQMATTSWGSTTNPHPHFSFVTAYFTNNARSEAQQQRGMDFPLVQETEEFGEVDIDALVVSTAEGMNIDQQREAVTQAAKVYNEVLGIFQMYERFGNNPAPEGIRVKAWPADDDPILKNSPYADGIPTMLILTGWLEPADGAEG